MKFIVQFEIIAFLWEIGVAYKEERNSGSAVVWLEVNSLNQSNCATPVYKALCSELGGIYTMAAKLPSCFPGSLQSYDDKIIQELLKVYNVIGTTLYGFCTI